jgi:hypothetical protein
VAAIIVGGWFYCSNKITKSVIVSYVKLIRKMVKIKKSSKSIGHSVKKGAEVIGHEIKENTELAEHEVDMNDIKKDVENAREEVKNGSRSAINRLKKAI